MLKELADTTWVLREEIGEVAHQIRYSMRALEAEFNEIRAEYGVCRYHLNLVLELGIVFVPTDSCTEVHRLRWYLEKLKQTYDRLEGKNFCQLLSELEGEGQVERLRLVKSAPLLLSKGSVGTMPQKNVAQEQEPSVTTTYKSKSV
ncbi:MAG: hypothetical protein V4490_06690 [Pseudomonadota bacterium]